MAVNVYFGQCYENQCMAKLCFKNILEGKLLILILRDNFLPIHSHE